MWRTPSLSLRGYCEFSDWGSEAANSPSTWRMNGTVPPPPLYALMVWCLIKAWEQPTFHISWLISWEHVGIARQAARDSRIWLVYAMSLLFTFTERLNACCRCVLTCNYFVVSGLYKIGKDGEGKFILVCEDTLWTVKNQPLFEKGQKVCIRQVIAEI